MRGSPGRGSGHRGSRGDHRSRASARRPIAESVELTPTGSRSALGTPRTATAARRGRARGRRTCARARRGAPRLRREQVRDALSSLGRQRDLQLVVHAGDDAALIRDELVESHVDHAARVDRHLCAPTQQPVALLGEHLSLLARDLLEVDGVGVGPAQVGNEAAHRAEHRDRVAVAHDDRARPGTSRAAPRRG